MMHRTRIKICGITRPEDARFAADCGADAIGLVMFAEARRAVTRKRAREIIDALPPFVTPVALFVNADPREVIDTAADLGIRHVQLHGDETADDVEALRDLAVVKAIRVNSDGFKFELDQWRREIAERRLTNLAALALETSSGSAIGGSGIANDWGKIAAHCAAGDFESLPPIIAAGGLTPASVASVVREIRPWAVDVSSGVEETFGQKSPILLAAFCAAVKNAT